MVVFLFLAGFGWEKGGIFYNVFFLFLRTIYSTILFAQIVDHPSPGGWGWKKKLSPFFPRGCLYYFHFFAFFYFPERRIPSKGTPISVKGVD